MKNLYSYLTTTALAVTLLGVLALPLSAQSPAPVELATVDVNPNFLDIQPQVEFGEVKITLTGPEGFEVIRTLQSDDPLAVELPARDGLYKYELRFSPVIEDETRQALEKARQDGTPAPKVATGNRAMWGTFSIAGGQVVAPNREESPSGDFPVPGVQNKSLDPDVLEKEAAFGDLYVYNSLCVGFDCVNGGETFGADTIRMKENNLRIHAEDTSGGSFPTTDWRLEFNSNLSGGASYFRVIDATASRNIMTVEANAPSNSLYVENSGEVGIGTANPVLELHAVDGDTPGLRLEQDTSSGFGAQVWDLAGNETSFFVRDATNGSTLPFRVFPGSASSSLVVRDSEVGVGTLSPADKLHVFKSSGGTNIRIESGDAGAGFRLKGNGHEGQIFMASDGDLRIRGLTGMGEITLDTSTGFVGINDTTPSGTLDVNGTIFLSGSQIHPDYVFEPSYELPSIEEQSAFMWENKHLPAVAPAKYNEDGKRVIELGANTAGILEELEKAHIYIEQLNDKLKAEETTNSELATRIQRLEALLLEQE